MCGDCIPSITCTVLQDQLRSNCIENHQDPSKSKLHLVAESVRCFQRRVHPSLCHPSALADTNYGALRSTLRCARISPVTLPDLCNYKRSERPCPHSRLSVTRGLHILNFDTLTTLASGKLSPGLIYPGPEASSLEPTTPDHVAGIPCCAAGEGDPPGRFVLFSGLRRPRCEPFPPVPRCCSSQASTMSTECLHDLYKAPYGVG